VTAAPSSSPPPAETGRRGTPATAELTSGDHDQIEAINIAALCAKLAAPAQDAGALGACVTAGGAWLFGLRHEAAVRGRAGGPASRHAAHSEVLQLREELMEGAPQPTRIARPRPRHGGTIERARDRVIDERRGNLYYRVTTII